MLFNRSGEAWIQQEPVIWDKSHELHNIANVQNSAWELVALKMNATCDGNYATGASLTKLWASLLAAHDHYCSHPSTLSFDFADNMDFLGKSKKQTCNLMKMKRKQVSFKHLLANITMVVILIFMVGNNIIKQPDVGCVVYHPTLLVFWCLATAAASLISFLTTWKDIQFRKNSLPIFIICVYAGIFIVSSVVRVLFRIVDCSKKSGNILFNAPSSSESDNSRSHYRSYATPNCTFDFFGVALLGIGFPMATLLSFGYHFIKISNKTALVSSLKTIGAAYFGSALLFFCFIGGIKWNISFFLFLVWLILNGKFSIDAVCNSWKSVNPDSKNYYSVSWNAAADQFDIVLNGPNHVPEVVLMPSVDTVEVTPKKEIILV